MEQLAKILQEQTGMSEELAEQAAKVAMSFLLDKLPGTMSTQVAAFLGVELDEDDGEGSDFAEAAEDLVRSTLPGVNKITKSLFGGDDDD